MKTFEAYNRDSTAKPTHIKVIVHEQHIECGSRADSRLCPLALAIIQRIGSSEVLITPGIIYLGENSYLMEEELTNIIRDYDKGAFMEPCVVVLV